MSSSSDIQQLEQRLHDDLFSLRDRLADEGFAGELYCALAGVAWSRRGTGEGHVALSWKRAERLVNDLRGDADPLTLAQTGGEGEVSSDVATALRELGWTSEAVDTSRNDPRHSSQEADSPPPADAGRAQAPEGATSEAERFAEAHVEADEGARDQAGGDHR